MQTNIQKDSNPDEWILRNCWECGNEFESRIYTDCGSRRYQELCKECWNDEKQKNYEQKQEHWKEEVKRLRAERCETQWLKVCRPLYRNTDINRLPKDQYKKAMSWEYGPKGLLLHGPTGTGKTRIALQVLKVINDQDIVISAFDSTDFVNICASKFMDGSGNKWIQSLIEVPMLFIDDMGNEPSGERGAGELFHVIKRRGEEELPIIITTNSVGKELAGKLKGPEDRGSAMVRRLREFCDTIAF